MDANWINDVSINVINKIKNIAQVWQDIGVAEEKFVTRSNVVKQHVYDLLDAMLIEEEQHKVDLEENIKKLTEEINIISQELNIISEEFIFNTNIPISSKNSLVKTENLLLVKRNELISTKKNRVERFHKLITKEREICERLYEFEQQFNPNIIPTEEDLEKLTCHIQSLELLQIHRKDQYIVKRNKIIEIFRILDKSVLDAFVEKIFKDSLAEEVPLSEDFLCQCDRLINKLLDELERNKKTCIDLRNRYSTLFGILYSTKNDVVYSHYACKNSEDFTCKTLEMLRSDVLLLEECRKEKLGEFIKNYQCRIRDKMISNLLSHFQKIDPYKSLLNSEECSEELFEKLEHELNYFSEIENQISPIVKEIQNWNACFTKLNELKLKLKDPIVLKNRGGILLKVEKEKNSVQKELPRSESRISNMLSSFKSDIITSEDLKIDDMCVLDYLLYQWNNIDCDKENDKKNSSKFDIPKSIVQKSTNVQKRIPLTKNSVNISHLPDTPLKKLTTIKNNSNVSIETPLYNANDYLQKSVSPLPKANHFPVKIQTTNKEPGFRIPKLMKVPPKKVLKIPEASLNKRFSQSCSNLNVILPIKKNFLGSNMNLYGDFCKDLERGIHTSSFIENTPFQKR